MAVTSNQTAAGDSNLQSQITALRESVRNHRERARKMWDACAIDATTDTDNGEARIVLGQFTEKFLKKNVGNEAYS